MSDTNHVLPVYTIVIGQQGTFTDDSTIDMAPLINAELAGAPAGYQVNLIFQPGIYGEKSPILVSSNTSVQGNNATLEHVNAPNLSDSGALIANKDAYYANGSYEINNTDGTTVKIAASPTSTTWLSLDPSSPVIDSNISVQGITFNDTGSGGGYTNESGNNFGTWFNNAQNIDIQNNVYVGGTDGNAFVNVTNSVVAENIAVGVINSAYDNWNGPVNITLENNETVMGNAPNRGWSVLINSTPTGYVSNPGNAINDGIIGNSFASPVGAAATNIDPLYAYGFSTISSITQQGNLDSNLESPNTQGYYAANINDSIVQDNLISGVSDNSGNNNVVDILSSSQTNPLSSNSQIEGNLVFGIATNSSSSAIYANGDNPTVDNNAVLGETPSFQNSLISAWNFLGQPESQGNIDSSGTTTSGRGVQPALSITAPATVFFNPNTSDPITGVSINNSNDENTITVKLTTTFGILQLTSNLANVTYGTAEGQQQITITGTSTGINSELASLVYVSNGLGWDDSIEVNVLDGGSTATRYIPVIDNNVVSNSSEVLRIPSQGLFTSPSQLPLSSQTSLPSQPVLSGNIVVALSGDNNIILSSLDSYALLGSGYDTVQGGSNQEYIATGQGSDFITLAQGGDITVAGGAGNAVIYATLGNDLIECGSTAATIIGGAGFNSIVGGVGNISIQGGSGELYFASLPQDGGNFTANLGSGNATLYALSGDANITTQQGTSNQIFLGIGSNEISSFGNDVIVTGTGTATISTAPSAVDQVVGNIQGVTLEQNSNVILVAGLADTVLSAGANDFIGAASANGEISVAGFANIIGTSGSTTITAVGSGSINAFVDSGFSGKLYFINDSSSASTVTGLAGKITVFGGIGGGHYEGGALGGNSLVGGTGMVTLVGSDAGSDTLVAGGSGAGFNVINAGGQDLAGNVTTGGNQVLVSTGVAGTTYFHMNGGLDQVSASGSGTQYFFLNSIGEATISGSTAAHNQFYLSQSTVETTVTDVISHFNVATDNFSIVNSPGVSISGVAEFGVSAGSIVTLTNGTRIELIGVNASIVTVGGSGTVF